MKSTIRFVSAMTLTLAAMTAQAATLTVADNLMIESINGKPVTEQVVSMPAGQHIVELRFSDRYYTSAASSGTWVTSQPMYAKVTVAETDVVTLSAPAIRGVADAKRYVQQPTAILTTEQGRQEQLEVITQGQLMQVLVTGI